jgi:hypothetical protein
VLGTNWLVSRAFADMTGYGMSLSLPVSVAGHLTALPVDNAAALVVM